MTEWAVLLDYYTALFSILALFHYLALFHVKSCLLCWISSYNNDECLEWWFQGTSLFSGWYYMKLLFWPSDQGLLQRSNGWFVLRNHKARVFSQPGYTRSATAPERMIASLFSHTLLTVLHSFFRESLSFPKGLCTWLSKRLCGGELRIFKKVEYE